MYNTHLWWFWGWWILLLQPLILDQHMACQLPRLYSRTSWQVHLRRASIRRKRPALQMAVHTFDSSRLLFKGCRPCRRPRKNRQWIKPNWQKWRTEKHQNCAQTLPNVTSETYSKFAILGTFSSCFLLLLLLLLVLLLLLFKKASSKGSRLRSNHSQRQIPMAVKDGKASKLRPKTP